jgi:hypothetical protein
LSWLVPGADHVHTLVALSLYSMLLGLLPQPLTAPERPVRIFVAVPLRFLSDLGRIVSDAPLAS